MNEVQQWLYEFNKWVADRAANIDDDVFIQLSVIERYLGVYGNLPTEPELLARVSKAVELYQEVVQEIGVFPSALEQTNSEIGD